MEHEAILGWTMSSFELYVALSEQLVADSSRLRLGPAWRSGERSVSEDLFCSPPHSFLVSCLASQRIAAPALHVHPFAPVSPDGFGVLAPLSVSPPPSTSGCSFFFPRTSFAIFDHHGREDWHYIKSIVRTRRIWQLLKVLRSS